MDITENIKLSFEEILKDLNRDYLVKCWQTGAFTVKPGNTRGRMTRFINLRLINKSDNSLAGRFIQEYKKDDETTTELLIQNFLKSIIAPNIKERLPDTVVKKLIDDGAIVQYYDKNNQLKTCYNLHYWYERTDEEGVFIRMDMNNLPEAIIDFIKSNILLKN